MRSYQDPPELKIEEVWLENGKTFEVQLICHVNSYPASTDCSALYKILLQL